MIRLRGGRAPQWRRLLLGGVLALLVIGAGRAAYGQMEGQEITMAGGGYRLVHATLDASAVKSDAHQAGGRYMLLHSAAAPDGPTAPDAGPCCCTYLPCALAP